LEQAKAMMFDLLTSVGDRERCSVECWPIYDDPELSPAGSGNMMYFLRFANLFRQKVGREMVDAKIASVFESQLEDILRRRNKNVTLADVEGTEQMLKAYDLQGQDYLFDYVDLFKAMLTGIRVKLLLCKKIFSSSDEEIEFCSNQYLHCRME
ncbi:MAG: thioredoxin, partial [Butyricimonas paravirosa]